MAVLDFTITLTGVDPALAGAGQAPWPAVARALRGSGIDHACVELARDETAAGWLGRYHADPLVLRGSGTYPPGLESNLAAALAEVAPQAGVVVDWDAHDPDLAARRAADRPAYRLARRLAALDAGAVPEYGAFVSRCAEADRERLGGEPVGADDPLHAGDEGPQYVVVSAVHAALVALGVDLLDLENGDTPGYLAIAPDLTSEVLAEAELARIPLSQHR